MRKKRNKSRRKRRKTKIRKKGGEGRNTSKRKEEMEEREAKKGKKKKKATKEEKKRQKEDCAVCKFNLPSFLVSRDEIPATCRYFSHGSVERWFDDVRIVGKWHGGETLRHHNFPWNCVFMP